ncbi:MAG: hypothetical protein ACKVU1_17370 [bacterium]
MISADAVVAWVGALLALMTLSALWGDSPLCKLAEHLFVGVSAAYWMSVAFWSTIVPNLLGRIYPPLLRAIFPTVPECEADLSLVAPLVLGLLLSVPLPARAHALRRIPIAFAVAYSAGAAIPRFLRADFIAQIEAVSSPIVVRVDGTVDGAATGYQIAGTAATIAALFGTFLYRRELRAMDVLRRAGRAAIAIGFGVAIGYMIVSRASVLASGAESLVAFARERL